MRKWVAAFVAICIGAAVGGILIVGSMRRQARAVEVTETTLMGDESTADGLCVETVYRIDYTYWSTATEWTADGLRTEAKYEQLSEGPELNSKYFKRDLVADRLEYYSFEKRAAYWWNVFGRPVSNGGHVVVMPLREITRYQPLKFRLNLWSEILKDAYEAEDKINEFLRIKAPEWQKVRLSYTTSWDSDLQRMEDQYETDFFVGEDWYYPRVMSVYTGEKIFFGVDNRSNNGQILDFSDIPGGYGVYMMPLRKVRELDKPVEYERKDSWEDYRWETVEIKYEIGEPAVVLPLDPEIRLCGMSQSEDLTKVFVLTLENGRYFADVIDTASLRVLAHIDLCEDDKTENPLIECHGGENFGAIYFWSMDRLFILYPYGEEWKPIDLSGLGERKLLGWCRFGDTRLACNGEKTAVFWDDDQYFSEVDYLVVFDMEKAVYAGEYCNSLEYTNRNENLISIDSVRREDTRIRWKE